MLFVEHQVIQTVCGVGGVFVILGMNVQVQRRNMPDMGGAKLCNVLYESFLGTVFYQNRPSSFGCYVQLFAQPEQLNKFVAMRQ